MSTLEPLAARYAYWLGLPAEETALPEAAPDEVRAMPVILRMEKADPPGRTPLLEAAAAAAVAVCLDDRAQPGGEWHDALHAWISGHIRKVARRARGAHWQAAQAFPGVTVTVGGAEVRALVPGRVVDVPKEIGRLQISGSDLPQDEPGEAPEDVPLVLLNPEVAMTVGKAAAQVGHATMILASLLTAAQLDAWKAREYACAVRTPTVAQWKQLHPGDDPAGAWRSRQVIAVRDAGFTEVAPGTVTVLAQWR
ncbi:peptidyl-tRNA hydrolase [Amycolatopsis rhizosphaerae]|uniref:peptidyl-tRNA hydrolase n=1 Tax=Amycolatopsis rhizosphaerae TaxID=2053003 RepID=A0A558B8R8_9PSEU|nr:peptidyl-tRNA hydrolase [Amycolatopsis rhizosphaerae]TVT32898.1 peptidyl-tRNA hydrolase [Amycolatopsis rhizosphaerae]